jgi:hypothetical protein
MPIDNPNPRDAANDGTSREDEPIPSASEDQVLEDTVRLAREGQQQRDADPKEPKTAKE